MRAIVSVVVPCYNAEKWIRDCLTSIIKQDLYGVEIIVIDDASTDRSLEVINNFKKLFAGAKVIQNEINLGECKTTANGFAAATGVYICRLSADDMFVSDTHLSRQIKEMEEYNLDWCYNSKNLVGENIEKSNTCQTAWFPLPVRYSAGWLYVFDNFILGLQNVCYLLAIKRNPINSSAMMIRARTYKRMIVNWDIGFRSVCDASFIGRMFLMGFSVRAIPEVGAFYRIHPGQATNTYEARSDLVGVRKYMIDHIVFGNYPTWMRTCAKGMGLLS